MDRDARAALLRERLISLLARSGPATAAQVAADLGISQPSVSRLLATLRGQVLPFGRARATRYALARPLVGVRQPLTVYEVRPAGEEPRRFAELQAVGTRGFHVAFAAGGAQFFDDLPWFLQNLRPSGFLGRLVPRRHPDLGFPADIPMWTADHAIRFAARFAWDASGAFIVGDEAYSRFLEESDRPSNVVDARSRRRAYPAIAEDQLSFGAAGSSAAGEQPKFLATRRDGDRLTPVLVKFSPPADNPIGRRIADLLVAEHAALATLGGRGTEVPAASVLSAGGRTFLEVERFDRRDTRHRAGQVALEALDAEFVGSDQAGWTASVEALVTRGVVPAVVVPRVRWLETFGRLIGNTDLHFGNLAFRLDGVRVTSLAPVYDMLPMHYHPRQGEVPRADHELPMPGPGVADVARSALDAAVDFWQRVAADDRVSPAFREIAARNAQRTLDLRPRLDRLPGA